MKYGGRYISPDVVNILEDKDTLIIEAYQSNGTPKDVNVYLLKDRRLKKIGRLPYSSPLIASDDDHYYAIEGLLLASGNRMEPPQGESLRYNKKDLTGESAFSPDETQFSLKAISKDNNFLWYSGFQNGSGQIVLFSKEELSGKLQRFMAETEVLFPSYVSDELNSIWFFKPDGGRTQIVVFSKKEKTFRQAELPIEIAPVPHGKLLTESAYLWAMAPSMREQQIYRIARQDLSFTSVPIPRDMMIDYFKVPVCSDDDNIWIGGTKPTGYSPPVPYVLRLHKNNMAVEEYLVKATPCESLQTAYENIGRIILAPILGGKQ